MKSLKKKICVSVFLDELFELVDEDSHDFIGGGYDGKEGDRTTAKVVRSANSELVHSQEEEILFQRVSRPRKYRNAWRMSQRDQINFRNQLQRQLEGSSDWLAARAPEKVDRATDPRKEEDDTQNDYDVDEYTESDLNLEMESLEEEKVAPTEKGTVDVALSIPSIKSRQSIMSHSTKTKDARPHLGKKISGSTQTEGNKNQVGTQVKMGPSPGSRSLTGPSSRILTKGKDSTKSDANHRRPRGGTAPPKADIDIVRDVKRNKKCFLVARCAKSTNLTGKYHKSTQFNLANAACTKPDMTDAESNKDVEKRLKAQCEALYESHHQDRKLEELFHYMSSRKTVNVVKRVHHMTTKRAKEGATPKKGPDRLNPRVSSEPTIGNALHLWDGGGTLDKWDGSKLDQRDETDPSHVIKKGFCDVTVKTFTKTNREQYLCYTLSIPWEITTLGEILIPHHAFKSNRDNDLFDTTNLFRSSRTEETKELEAFLLGTDCDKSFRYSDTDNNAIVGISITEMNITKTSELEKQDRDKDDFTVLTDISEMDGETHIEVVCDEDEVQITAEEVNSAPCEALSVNTKKTVDEEIATSKPDLEVVKTSKAVEPADVELVVQNCGDSNPLETEETPVHEEVKESECLTLSGDAYKETDAAGPTTVEEVSKRECVTVVESAETEEILNVTNATAVDSSEANTVEEVSEEAVVQEINTAEFNIVEAAIEEEKISINEIMVKPSTSTKTENEVPAIEADASADATKSDSEDVPPVAQPLVEQNPVTAESEAVARVDEAIVFENSVSYTENVTAEEEQTVKTATDEKPPDEIAEKASTDPSSFVGSVELDSIDVDYSEVNYTVSTPDDGNSKMNSLDLMVRMEQRADAAVGPSPETCPEDAMPTEAKETMTDTKLFDVKQELCLITDKSVNTEPRARETRSEPEEDVAVQWELEIEIQNESESTQMIPAQSEAEKDSETQIIRALEAESNTNVILICQTPCEGRFLADECYGQSTCASPQVQVEQCYLKDEKIRKMYLANVPRHLLHATERRLKEVGRG